MTYAIIKEDLTVAQTITHTSYGGSTYIVLKAGTLIKINSIVVQSEPEYKLTLINEGLEQQRLDISCTEISFEIPKEKNTKYSVIFYGEIVNSFEFLDNDKVVQLLYGD